MLFSGIKAFAKIPFRVDFGKNKKNTKTKEIPKKFQKHSEIQFQRKWESLSKPSNLSRQKTECLPLPRKMSNT
jgi:hypothetical protein